MIKGKKVAVLSGKGGTGKTLVAVNLAEVAYASAYIDCDVEEPNGHLFFKPKNLIKKDVKVRIPIVNQNLCDGCRRCIDFCNFNSLAYIKGQLIVFEELCHSCGGCMITCPNNAINEKSRIIGYIEKGKVNNVHIVTGFLNPGIASGTPIISELINMTKTYKKQTVFIDCPPGSSCIVMDSIKDADYCLLVAENTIFGLENLRMVVELAMLFEKPFGIIINKDINNVQIVWEYCQKKGYKILGSIPYDNSLGRLNSKGHIAARISNKYRTIFISLLKEVEKELRNETTINS